MIEEVPAPQAVRVDGISVTQEIGVWLVNSAADLAGFWESLLAAVELHGVPSLVLRGRLAPEAGSLAALRRGPGEVLLVAGEQLASEAWLAEVRASGKGVVVAAHSPLPELWSEAIPVVFVPASPAANVLGLALLSAEAAARREVRLRQECETLQLRLQDRILLERAKGILVHRLNITEEEAYRRLRGTARRQRRPLRDVARAIVDTECLLDESLPSCASVEEVKR